MLDNLIQYFTTIPSLHRALILAGGISFFWIIEGFVPLYNLAYSKWKHAGVNLFFTITTIIVNFLFAVLIVKVSDWCVANNFGLLHIFELNNWMKLIFGLLLLDFVGAYCVHLIEHKVSFMWRFHAVHHADTIVDTTTANRHHPGESFFRVIFTLIGVFICGAPIWVVMLYQSCSVVWAQFSHANIRLPIWLDSFLSLLVVSPNMHKIHHHFVRPQTDSNYGNIFSIWDRLLGTFNYTPIEHIRYGLDVLDNAKDKQLLYQIKVPFDKNFKTDY